MAILGRFLDCLGCLDTVYPRYLKVHEHDVEVTRGGAADGGAANGTGTALVRLDIYPDGGVSRLRLVGVVPPERREQIARRWLSLLPADVASGVDQGEFFD